MPYLYSLPLLAVKLVAKSGELTLLNRHVIQPKRHFKTCDHDSVTIIPNLLQPPQPLNLSTTHPSTTHRPTEHTVSYQTIAFNSRKRLLRLNCRVSLCVVPEQRLPQAVTAILLRTLHWASVVTAYHRILSPFELFSHCCISQKAMLTLP